MNIVTIYEWNGWRTVISQKPIKLVIKAPFSKLSVVIRVTGECKFEQSMFSPITLETDWLDDLRSIE